MLVKKYLPLFAIILLSQLSQISCGVKGPPLPPLVIIPDKTEPQVKPGPK